MSFSQSICEAANICKCECANQSPENMGYRTSDDAVAVISSMAGRCSDEHIAASLNRMGMPTGQGKTWTGHRVSWLRRMRGIHAYRSAEKNGEWLTASDAAKLLGVSDYAIRRAIKRGSLAADQVMPDAPYQMRASDLENPKVVAAITRKVCPSRTKMENQLPMFSDT
jgi:hypothetical protein